MVGGSTKIPKVRYMIQSFFKGKALNISVSPDEAIAAGAAIQAAKLNDDFSNSQKKIISFYDEIPLTS